ncbi:MAG: hypothetical protein ACFFB3_19875 [Candidatus Hodarchaeota archaeon]
MMVSEKKKTNRILPDDILQLFQTTWLRIGLAKLAMANCLAGRPPLSADEVTTLSEALLPNEKAIRCEV